MAIPAAGLLCGLIGCVVVVRDRERLWAWGTVTLMAGFSIGLTFWQIRAGPAAQLLAIAPLACAIWALARWLIAGPGLARRVIAIPGLALLGSAASAYPLYPVLAPYWNPPKPTVKKAPPVNGANKVDDDDEDDDEDDARPRRARERRNQITQIFSSSSRPERGTNRKTGGGSAAGRCRSQPALQALDEIPAATIFTMVDLGPRLIAMSHHSAIAGPYHRNEKAILDIHHAMDGDPENFRTIAAAHGAAYLLVCPGFPEGTIYQQRSPKGFYARLMRGETFPFLTPVKLSYPATLPFTLYRITPQKQRSQTAP
jgi:hypothetical protein